MAVIDNFDQNGNYEGGSIESLTPANFSRLAQENGTEWINGYIRALEIVEIDISNILRDNSPGSSMEQTPHRVRANLKKYWAINKHLLFELLPLIESIPKRPDQPELK